MIKKTKYFIVLMLLVLFLSISVVSASDNTTGHTLEKTTQPLEKIVTSTEEKQIQKENKNVNTTQKEKQTINKKNTTQNTKTATYDVSDYNGLRQALTSGSDVTINIQSNITLEGSTTINKAIKTLTINGNNKTINGNNQYQFLNIPSQATVNIDNIKITNCKDVHVVHETERGQGGAIYNQGKLTITRSTLNNNYAGQEGGAIYVGYDGSLTIQNSTLNNNKVSIWGGAIFTFKGPVTIQDCTFNNNTAPEGGAITHYQGTINKVENTEFINNTPANFVIENNVIKFKTSDDYLNVGNFTIIIDDTKYSGYGSGNLSTYSDFGNIFNR